MTVKMCRNSVSRTRSAITIQGSLIGLGVEDPVWMDGECALDPVQECHIDGVAHCGPENGPQVSQIGILS